MSKKRNILILFGGVSPEHEVSIITGLQVAENIDRTQFIPHIVYFTKQRQMLSYPGLKTRQDFARIRPKTSILDRDRKGAFLETRSITKKRTPIDAAYLAFHGGEGESGPVQGMLQALGIPFTSPAQEASVITMNKILTKQTLASENIPVVPWWQEKSPRIRSDYTTCATEALATLNLPVIVKPAHLGSSIGIHIAHTEIALQKALSEVALYDSEVLVERLIPDFVEYNCAVRKIGDNIETSAIERPKNNDEILSFADKYERGGGKKKTGGAGGMASLSRELPAKINPQLKKKIETTARKAFTACRCDGMVRIDFMVTPDEKEFFITEINPIPGSMSFYLWEANGISFRQQITDLLNQSYITHRNREALHLDYTSDIVKNFIQ